MEKMDLLECLSLNTGDKYASQRSINGNSISNSPSCRWEMTPVQDSRRKKLKNKSKSRRQFYGYQFLYHENHTYLKHPNDISCVQRLKTKEKPNLNPKAAIQSIKDFRAGNKQTCII